MRPSSVGDVLALMGDEVGFPRGINLDDVPCLGWISIRGDSLVVGSLVLWGRLRESDLVKEIAPRLWDLSGAFDEDSAVGESLLEGLHDGAVGHLMALGARMELISSVTHREIELCFPVRIGAGELLLSVLFPLL